VYFSVSTRIVSTLLYVTPFYTSTFLRVFWGITACHMTDQLTRRAIGPSGPLKLAKKEAPVKAAAKPAAKPAAKAAAKVRSC